MKTALFGTFLVVLVYAHQALSFTPLGGRIIYEDRNSFYEMTLSIDDSKKYYVAQIRELTEKEQAPIEINEQNDSRIYRLLQNFFPQDHPFLTYADKRRDIAIPIMQDLYEIVEKAHLKEGQKNVAGKYITAHFVYTISAISNRLMVRSLRDFASAVKEVGQKIVLDIAKSPIVNSMWLIEAYNNWTTVEESAEQIRFLALPKYKNQTLNIKGSPWLPYTLIDLGESKYVDIYCRAIF